MNIKNITVMLSMLVGFLAFAQNASAKEESTPLNNIKKIEL